jgi:hypothetical protein
MNLLNSQGGGIFLVFVAVQVAFLLFAGAVIVLGVSAVRQPSTRSKFGGAVVVLIGAAFGLAALVRLFRML